MNRALALAREGRMEEARKILLLGRLKYARDKRFALELAGVEYRLENRPAAKAYLHAALRLDPHDSYGNEFLGTLYLLEGNIAAALKYWNRINRPVLQDVRLEPEPELDPVLRARMIAVSGGQIFTLPLLRQTETNLDRLDVFSGYRMELAPGPEERFDFTIRAVEIASPASAWVGHVLPYIRSLPYQAVEFDRFNLGRRAINFRSLWRWDPNKRRIAASLSGPLHLRPDWRYRIFADLRNEEWDLTNTYRGSESSLPNLLMRTGMAGADFSFGVFESSQWTTGFDVGYRTFQRADDAPCFSKGWSFTQRNRLDHQLTYWPERRIHADAFVQLRTGRVFAAEPSKFAALEGGVSARWVPGASQNAYALASLVQAGRAFGTVPFDQYMALGMERDSGLWLRGHVAARNGKKGNAPLGVNYALFQSELDRTLWKFGFVSVEAGPFFDTGWIAGPPAWIGSQGWLYDTGAQAKIRTFGLTWTFVYGRNLREGGGVFYTGVSRLVTK